MNNILIQLKNSMSPWNRKGFVELLKVDLEHCQPEIFNGKRYNINKKLYSNDLFLFINDRGALVGATIGATYQKDFENYSCYVFDLTKNRKGLENRSNIILRIASEDRIYTRRFNKKYSEYVPSTPSLKSRLKKYKNSKNKNIRPEQVENMLQELITTFANNVFNKNYDIRKFESVAGWYGDIEDLAQTSLSLARQYKQYSKRLEREKNEYKEQKLEWVEKNSFSYNNYIQLITQINDWYKLLKNEK